ncbi:MAG TPA: Holliday junction resolvase RuvX [Stellaceae bacterium]|nr:Holliday junction resolvase RuvX [Stellaceae bacterium]
MPLRNLTDLPPLLQPGQRLLGIDLGTKTIGLALSDRLRLVATPLTTLTRGKFRDDAAALQRLRAEHGVGALVLGLPLNMDGSDGPRAQATRAFARNLLAIDGPELCLWDERLSTAAVERGMIEADLSRRRRSEIVDRAAAAYILQGALDRLARLVPPSS